MDLNLPFGTTVAPRAAGKDSPNQFVLSDCACIVTVTLQRAFPPDARIWQRPSLKDLGNGRYLIVNTEDPRHTGVDYMIQTDGYNVQVVASSPASIDGAVPLLRDIAEKASVLVGS